MGRGQRFCPFNRFLYDARRPRSLYRQYDQGEDDLDMKNAVEGLEELIRNSGSDVNSAGVGRFLRQRR